MPLQYAVYILQCANGQCYTGFTTNLISRLKSHNAGEIHFTKDKLPVKLIYISYFHNKQKAYDFERYLKSGSGIAFRNKRLLWWQSNPKLEFYESEGVMAFRNKRLI